MEPAIKSHWSKAYGICCQPCGRCWSIRMRTQTQWWIMDALMQWFKTTVWNAAWGRLVCKVHIVSVQYWMYCLTLTWLGASAAPLPLPLTNFVAKSKLLHFWQSLVSPIFFCTEFSKIGHSIIELMTFRDQRSTPKRDVWDQNEWLSGMFSLLCKSVITPSLDLIY